MVPVELVLVQSQDYFPLQIGQRKCLIVGYFHLLFLVQAHFLKIYHFSAGQHHPHLYPIDDFDDVELERKIAKDQALTSLAEIGGVGYSP